SGTLERPASSVRSRSIRTISRTRFTVLTTTGASTVARSRTKNKAYNDTRHQLLKGSIMPNKLVTALKENKNDIRKKVVIATAVTVGVIATAVVLSKMKDNAVDVLVVST